MTPLSHWIWFHVAIVVLLALEYLLHLAFPDPRRKAIYATILWVVAALSLAAVLVRFYTSAGAVQYLAGYAIEEALSIDNLFVFLMLFRLFRVPEVSQPKVLFWGVAGAIVMRGGFIAAGLGLLSRFHWISYAFGAVLLLALIAVELTDVVFALDSIPAVLSITRQPFLAYTSNIMAVMGLRSLYVLLAIMLAKLRFIHYGLAALLAFAAVKMLISAWVEIGPLVSLAVIAGLLAVTIGASLVAARKQVVL